MGPCDAGVAASVIGEGCQTLHGLAALGINSRGGDTADSFTHQKVTLKQLQRIVANIGPLAVLLFLDELSMCSADLLLAVCGRLCDALDGQPFRDRNLPFCGIPVVLKVGKIRTSTLAASPWARVSIVQHLHNCLRMCTSF